MGKATARAYARSINRVIDFIYAHLDEELSVTQLSRIGGFSPYHFHRQFTGYTGISVYRLVQLVRMKRASMQLVFNPGASVTDIALDAGFATLESFSRAFKKECGQSPSGFRNAPHWKPWQTGPVINSIKENESMQVTILDFPRTMVAALEHHGPESGSYHTVRKFIDWRQENGISAGTGNTYGIHYCDPVTTLPEDYRLDICVSVDQPVQAGNPQGVVTKFIPGGRCAVVRHQGSRDHIPEARYLYRQWLPASGEELRDFPIFFHYLNVGPEVKDHEMVTDIYLPLK